MVSNDTSCRKSRGTCACHMMGGSHGFLYYGSRGLDVDMRNSSVVFSDSPTNTKLEQRAFVFLLFCLFEIRMTAFVYM